MMKSAGIEAKPLVCGACGNQLPVMGRLLAFRCERCLAYWIAGEDGLQPLAVFRAVPPEEIKAGCIWLPFWIVPADPHDLRAQFETAAEGIRDVSQTILGTKIERETPAFGLPPEFDLRVQFGLRARREDELDPGLERSRFVSEASSVKRMPAASELGPLMSRLAGTQPLNIFVPAFSSPNTYAYLKVGRLLTRLNPVMSIEKSDGAGRPVLCALAGDEAVDLIDFIYFATLPNSIQGNADLLERIHLKPLHPPRLVELPFIAEGSQLMSLFGKFWISKRLVEAFVPEEAKAQTEWP